MGYVYSRLWFWPLSPPSWNLRSSSRWDKSPFFTFWKPKIYGFKQYKAPHPSHDTQPCIPPLPTIHSCCHHRCRRPPTPMGWLKLQLPLWAQVQEKKTEKVTLLLYLIMPISLLQCWPGTLSWSRCAQYDAMLLPFLHIQVAARQADGGLNEQDPETDFIHERTHGSFILAPMRATSASSGRPRYCQTCRWDVVQAIPRSSPNPPATQPKMAVEMNSHSCSLTLYPKPATTSWRLLDATLERNWQ